MTLLPDSLTVLTSAGEPASVEPFRRVDPLSPEGRRLSEADWDRIICANVAALADALRAAGIIPETSTLRVLGQQVDAVDVLLAEVPVGEDGDAGGEGTVSRVPPRRLVLLEDKLLRNPQAKREVLAQILDYAERAQSDWTVDALCRQVDPEVASWMRLHEARLKVMLAQREFLLVIAGDDIDADLLRLARRFATGGDPLSLAELCLVSLTVYRRGDEHLLIPHVVSAVERHQRQLAIRVTVQGEDGRILPASIDRDPEAEADAARGGSIPRNRDVEAFLLKAKKILDDKLLRDDLPYIGLKNKPRKNLRYWMDAQRGARLKIHFGGFVGDAWSPIQVGLYVESRTRRDEWIRRVEEADAAGQLPVGTVVRVTGVATVEALKSFAWTTPSDLTEELLKDVVETLLRFEAIFGGR